MLESLSNRLPIIGWPLAADQVYNAKMLVEEMGVSVALTQTMESVIYGDEVKKVIKMVMDQDGGKGKGMKEKANEIALHMRKAKSDKGEVKRTSTRAMDDFVRTILSTKSI